GRRLRSRRLGRGEHHDDREPLGYVVEAMLDAGGHEGNRSWADRNVFGAHPEATTAVDHDVDPVLAVGLLRVGATRLDDVEAGRQRRDAEELVVEAARGTPLRFQPVELET